MNNVSKTNLINKISEEFNDYEKQLFVSSFYAYANSKSDDFIIDFDKVWQWMGFSRKDSAKRLLASKLIENKDFIIIYDEKSLKEDKLAPQKSGASLKEDNANLNDKYGGQNKETIYLTINAFKKFCMKAGTSRSDEIHDYFIKLENILMKVVEDENINIREQLKIKDNIINNLNGTNEQPIDPNNFKNKHVVYLIDIESDKETGEKYYKFGWTSDIMTRLRTHTLKMNKNARLIKCCNATCQEIALEIERCIKKYVKNNKIGGTYDNKRDTEIIKTSEIGIVKEKMDKWTEECINNFSQSHDIDFIKQQQALLKQKNELVDKLINLGINSDDILNTISPIVPTTPIIPENVMETKEEQGQKYSEKENEENEEDLGKIKCTRCAHKFSPDKFEINITTNQPYTTCITCRKKASDKLEQLSKEKRKEIEEDSLKKLEQLNKVRENIININKVVNCYRCHKSKTPDNFGVNKRVNELYKICTDCRSLDKSFSKNINDSSKSIISETSECSKCHKEFPTELNKLSKLNYKTCTNCREKDRLNNIKSKEQINNNINNPECTYCHKIFETELNAKKDGFYKNCKDCRDSRKKYDKKRTEVHGKTINEKKKEYYAANHDEIRAKQKEYYDLKNNENL